MLLHRPSQSFLIHAYIQRSVEATHGAQSVGEKVLVPDQDFGTSVSVVRGLSALNTPPVHPGSLCCKRTRPLVGGWAPPFGFSLAALVQPASLSSGVQDRNDHVPLVP